MFDVSVHVEISIPILGDESITKIAPPEGFVFRKVPLSAYKHKDRITDGRGKISFDFHYAVHDNQTTIVVLECSSDEIVEHVSPANSIVFALGDGLETISEPIQDKYEQRLFRYFSMLRVYMEGEIARKYSFYQFSTEKDSVRSNHTCTPICADEPTLILYPMVISDDKISDINAFITGHDRAYALLKNVIIDDLVYSYHVIDGATAYKNLITPLEVMFLSGEYGSKKKMLAKRISVLIGSTDSEIRALYDDIIQHYVDRNDAVHEGAVASITRDTVNNLRNIIRRVIKAEFNIIESFLITNPTLTFDELKAIEVPRLKGLVIQKIGEGVLPE